MSNFLSQYYRTSGESMFYGWVLTSFRGVVGYQNCNIISDCDGMCVGESTSHALRLLLMGCVDMREAQHMPNWLIETQDREIGEA